MNEVYEQLEDDLIRLNYAYSQIGWWGRLWGKATPELEKAMVAIYTSMMTMCKELEKRHLLDRIIWDGVGLKEKNLWVKARNFFLVVIRRFPSTDIWNENPA